MQLTEKQQEAIKNAVDWYNKDLITNSGSSQIFTIAGYAGTGKSTIVNEMVKTLNLSRNEVRFVTFTGKASLVLTRKGNNACTIHKLIYDVVEYYDEKTKKTKTKFSKKIFLDPEIKLLVIDEVSMVPEDILTDLKSYGKKIITLGDPGQLPAIGKNSNLLENPDIFLKEIHRQAEDSPIIYLSMLAREGKQIPYGMMGKKAGIFFKDEINDDVLLKSDQILCGKNDTRNNLNSYMRKLLGFSGDLPNYGEKLICTRNNWNVNLEDTALINGLIGYVHNPLDVENIDMSERTFLMDFRPEFLEDNYFEAVICNMENFVSFPKEEERLKNITDEDDLFAAISNSKLNFKNRNNNDFDFGYAITVHRSQGSEYSKVFVYDERIFRDSSDYNRWLYTAITRSSNKLIIATDRKKYY